MAKFVQSGRGRSAEAGAKRNTSRVSPGVSSEVSEYLAAIGKRGGEKGGLAKVPKGTAALSAAKRKALGKKAAAARWGTKKAKGGRNA